MGRKIRCVAFGVLMLGAGGCAVAPGTGFDPVPGEVGGREATRPITAAERAIVDDLSDAMAGLLGPRDTTLQVNAADDDPLTRAWVDALSGLGFGIQRVPADQGPRYLTHETVRLDAPDAYAYRLTAGNVEVSRDYRLADGERVSAVSPVRVAGSRARIAIGASGRTRVIAASPLLDRVEYVGPAPLDRPSPIISLVTPSVIEGVVQSSVGAPSRRAISEDRIELGNLYFGDDAFASLDSSHRRVGRHVIVFGNDSMVLGADNRAVLERFVDEELRVGDIVGLVGCSNGATALDIGNEGLALGRAARVTEALVERGVARERIHDQGCWAPVDAGDRFPSRGVVLELWRRNA